MEGDPQSLATIEGTLTTTTAIAAPHPAKRQQDSTSSPSTASISGDVASVISQSDVVYQTSTTPTGAYTTELAIFTADGGVYSVTRFDDGELAVAGKTISPGGPAALVGGQVVTALPPPGTLAVGNGNVSFETVTFSPSESTSEVAMSSSAAPAAGSESAAASEGAASGSESAGKAVARATAGVGAMVAVGAFVGVLVL